MKKIVIKTSQPEPDFSLIALLNTLFPECEIQIVFTPETMTKGSLEVLEQVDITRQNTKWGFALN